MSTWGMPGPGGSLGRCAVCGDAFMKEILFGDSVVTFRVGFVEDELCAHGECIDVLKGCVEDGKLVPERLPDGPLLKAYQDAVESLSQHIAEADDAS